MSGTPAATLLHLGPGLANGWANLHNARRARVPLVNIVGDHATYHVANDALLQSDIGSVASALNGWQRRATSADTLARDTADAVGAAYGPPGRVATLIVPADVSWSEVPGRVDEWPEASRASESAPDESVVARALDVLRTKRTALYVGASALAADQLALAQRVAAASGSRLLVETFPAIMDRGAGVVHPEPINYISEFAIAQLSELDALITLGVGEPVAMFAYPGVAHHLVAPDCELVNVAPPGTNVRAVLAALVEGLNAPEIPAARGERPTAPTGVLNSRSMAAAVGATIFEGLIVVDEALTSGIHLSGATQFSPAHQWLSLTGGSIGDGLPVAVGASVASGRRVLALESDGSMLYTPQALWTVAREGLDVTVVGLANRRYAILNFERQRLGATESDAPSRRLLEIDNPTLDLCAIASGLGVPSTRVTSADELVTALQRSYATPGPMFIEAVLPTSLD